MVWVLLLGIAMMAAPLSAQTSSSLTRAAETITAADISRHISVIAADSMQGRATPSRGLELTAQYVAKQFQQLGLKGDIWAEDHNLVQRYPIPGQLQLDYAQSAVEFSTALVDRGKKILNEHGQSVTKQVVADFATAARFADSTTVVLPRRYNEDSRPTVLVTGRHTAASLRQAKATLRGTNVLYVPPAGGDSAGRQQVLEQLAATGHAVVIPSAEDSATFATQLQAARQHPLRIADDYMNEAAIDHSIIQVRPAAIQSLLAAAGVDLDLARARADSAPLVRKLLLTQVKRRLQVDTTLRATVTAPNVMGWLEGTDSILKRQYIVISAHMDHTGIRQGPGDSIAQGADDNASGVAGLLALAKAFSQPGMRPQWSVVFVATSGGAKDKAAWGGHYFITTHQGGYGTGPVFNLTLDRIGHPAGDSITVEGLEDVELVKPLSWVIAAHPELRLILTQGDNGDSGVNPHADFPSDDDAFASLGVPSLSLHAETHGNDASRMELPRAIDAEQEARILQLVFYLGQEIGNAPRPPQWNSTGRGRLLKNSIP